ncbi:hypothetical protein NUACC21_61160 [Scytonema sp. NUACC21]
MSQKQANSLEGIFAGGGQMGTLMRCFDWASTPLGSVETWSQSLRTAVSILLNSPYPTAIFWGFKFIQFYNDAYIPILTEKHPQALGQSMPQVLPELWSITEPVLQSVMETGEPAESKDIQLFVNRNGYLEEIYMTFSYSAIRDENARVVGIFVACTETIQTVIRQRRPNTIQNLAVRGSDTKTVGDTHRLMEENYEQQLRMVSERAHGKLRTILESITDAFIALDKDWRICYVNQKVARTSRQPLDHLVGKRIWEQWPWLIGTEVEREFRRAVTEQVAVHLEIFYDPLDIWLEIHAYPSEDGLNIFLRDISDRKRMEVLLLESEERLRLAVEGSDLGMWDYDLQSGDLVWSERCKAMFGAVSDDTITYELFLNALHPSDRERVDRSVQLVITGGNDYKMEFRTLWPDGTVHWVASRGRAYRDENGKPIRMVGAVLDITAIKHVEDALRQNEAHLAMAQRVAQVGSWEFDLEKQKIIWSETTFNHWGIDPTQLEPSYGELLERVYPDDRELLRQAVERVIVEGVPYAFDLRILRPDGSIRYLDSRGEPLFNEAGQVIKLIGTSMDITDRKQTELALQQAKEAAETASRIKDDFLAILSHELRSPLNPILAWAQLLRSRKYDPATTDRALEAIERNAKLQTQLIEDLLDMSRILQGKLILNVKSVNLVFVIKSAVETIRVAAQSKAIQIQTILDSTPLQIKGDSTRLQQVVWNLLSNAIKFTPSGGQVTVKLEYFDSYAQIQVSDTGKGISKDFLPHVFERFRQESRSTTREFGGLGLGLSIVRHLIKLHDGSVYAESPGDNLGATFTVRLPLHLAESAVISQEEKPKTRVNFSGVRVLVVDDEADMRELLARLLEDLGANVTVTKSATEALAVLRQQVPDILLSDIGMPNTDGYMLMRQVRIVLSEQGRQIPAIALTAYAGEYDQQRAQAAGFQMHISKPVEPVVLIQAIDSLVQRRSCHVNFGVLN